MKEAFVYVTNKNDYYLDSMHAVNENVATEGIGRGWRDIHGIIFQIDHTGLICQIVHIINLKWKGL